MEGKQISFYQIDYRTKEKAFVSKPHAHNHYEIFFLEQGAADHFIDFQQYPILDHSLFLVSKNQVHYITAQPHTYNFGYVISIGSELVELLDKDLFSLFGSPTQSPAYQITSHPFFSSVFQQIKSELMEEKPKRLRIVFDLLKVLLTYVWRASGKRQSVRKKSEATFLKFTAYLEDHFTNIRSVKEYAKLMRLTTGQLNRICKANCNQTTLGLIHHRINLEAKRKIFFSQDQIKEIAFQLGFEDTGHFNNFFKKLNGQSPIKFREEMHQIFN
ncbi:MAG: AraC family transcriptional regulator [Bacteroidota bacterium]